MANFDFRVPSLSAPIRIVGDESTTIDAAALADRPLCDRECEIVCATGDRYTETWQGVSVLELLEFATVTPETTHLLVESADGHRTCVAVETALEGLLALGKTASRSRRLPAPTTRPGSSRPARTARGRLKTFDRSRRWC